MIYQSESKMMTVSAPVSVIPTPPARVERRKSLTATCGKYQIVSVDVGRKTDHQENCRY